MKNVQRICVAMLCLVAAAGSVLAHGYPYYRSYYPRSNVQFGMYVGSAWGYPVYRYPVPVYLSPVVVNSPPSVVISQPPPVYVEQPPVASAAPSTLEAGFWYYCAQSQAYYPYVKECPAGWQKVPPAPVK